MDGAAGEGVRGSSSESSSGGAGGVAYLDGGVAAVLGRAPFRAHCGLPPPGAALLRGRLNALCGGDPARWPEPDPLEYVSPTSAPFSPSASGGRGGVLRVEAYRRSAAGVASSPADLRAPLAVEKALHLLVERFLRAPPPAIARAPFRAWAYLWDRFRGARTTWGAQLPRAGAALAGCIAADAGANSREKGGFDRREGRARGVRLPRRALRAEARRRARWLEFVVAALAVGGAGLCAGPAGCRRFVREKRVFSESIAQCFADLAGGYRAERRARNGECVAVLLLFYGLQQGPKCEDQASFWPVSRARTRDGGARALGEAAAQSVNLYEVYKELERDPALARTHAVRLALRLLHSWEGGRWAEFFHLCARARRLTALQRAVLFQSFTYARLRAVVDLVRPDASTATAGLSGRPRWRPSVAIAALARGLLMEPGDCAEFCAAIGLARLLSPARDRLFLSDARGNPLATDDELDALLARPKDDLVFPPARGFIPLRVARAALAAFPDVPFFAPEDLARLAGDTERGETQEGDEKANEGEKSPPDPSTFADADLLRCPGCPIDFMRTLEVYCPPYHAEVAALRLEDADEAWFRDIPAHREQKLLECLEEDEKEDEKEDKKGEKEVARRRRLRAAIAAYNWESPSTQSECFASDEELFPDLAMPNDENRKGTPGAFLTDRTLDGGEGPAFDSPDTTPHDENENEEEEEEEEEEGGALLPVIAAAQELTAKIRNDAAYHSLREAQLARAKDGKEKASEDGEKKEEPEGEKELREGHDQPSEGGVSNAAELSTPLWLSTTDSEETLPRPSVSTSSSPSLSSSSSSSSGNDAVRKENESDERNESVPERVITAPSGVLSSSSTSTSSTSSSSFPASGQNSRGFLPENALTGKKEAEKYEERPPFSSAPSAPPVAVGKTRGNAGEEAGDRTQKTVPSSSLVESRKEPYAAPQKSFQKTGALPPLPPPPAISLSTDAGSERIDANTLANISTSNHDRRHLVKPNEKEPPHAAQPHPKLPISSNSSVSLPLRSERSTRPCILSKPLPHGAVDPSFFSHRLAPLFLDYLSSMAGILLSWSRNKRSDCRRCLRYALLNAELSETTAGAWRRKLFAPLSGLSALEVGEMPNNGKDDCRGRRPEGSFGQNSPFSLSNRALCYEDGLSRELCCGFSPSTIILPPPGASIDNERNRIAMRSNASRERLHFLAASEALGRDLAERLSTALSPYPFPAPPRAESGRGVVEEAAKTGNPRPPRLGEHPDEDANGHYEHFVDPVEGDTTNNHLMSGNASLKRVLGVLTTYGVDAAKGLRRPPHEASAEEPPHPDPTKEDGGRAKSPSAARPGVRGKRPREGDVEDRRGHAVDLSRSVRGAKVEGGARDNYPRPRPTSLERALCFHARLVLLSTHTTAGVGGENTPGPFNSLLIPKAPNKVEKTVKGRAERGACEWLSRLFANPFEHAVAACLAQGGVGRCGANTREEFSPVVMLGEATTPPSSLKLPFEEERREDVQDEVERKRRGLANALERGRKPLTVVGKVSLYAAAAAALLPFSPHSSLSTGGEAPFTAARDPSAFVSNVLAENGDPEDEERAVSCPHFTAVVCLDEGGSFSSWRRALAVLGGLAAAAARGRSDRAAFIRPPKRPEFLTRGGDKRAETGKEIKRGDEKSPGAVEEGLDGRPPADVPGVLVLLRVAGDDGVAREIEEFFWKSYESAAASILNTGENESQTDNSKDNHNNITGENSDAVCPSSLAERRRELTAAERLLRKLERRFSFSSSRAESPRGGPRLEGVRGRRRNLRGEVLTTAPPRQEGASSPASSTPRSFLDGEEGGSSRVRRNNRHRCRLPALVIAPIAQEDSPAALQAAVLDGMTMLLRSNLTQLNPQVDRR